MVHPWGRVWSEAFLFSMRAIGLLVKIKEEIFLCIMLHEPALGESKHQYFLSNDLHPFVSPPASETPTLPSLVCGCSFNKGELTQLCVLGTAEPWKITEFSQRGTAMILPRDLQCFQMHSSQDKLIP